MILLALILSLALEMATAAEFPITENDDVLRQLHRYTSTSGRRRHMRQCFQRMKKYRSFISKRIKAQGLPMELMAIPVVESCYQNIHSEQGWGSGLWMFIRPTARAYGLKVNKKVDQRMNVKLSTEAALTYLKSNHKRFKDWRLAILAYNMGENKLAKGIKRTGSRDPWILIRRGYEGDKGYLAKVMAVALMMKRYKRNQPFPDSLTYESIQR